MARRSGSVRVRARGHVRRQSSGTRVAILRPWAPPAPSSCFVRPPGSRRRTLGYVIAVVGPGLLVLRVRCPWRDQLEPLTIGFTFLVVVVLRGGGRPARPRHPRGVRVVPGVQLLLPAAVRHVRDRARGARRRAVRVPRAVGADLVAVRARDRAGGRGRGEGARAARRCRSSAATSWCADRGEDTYRALLDDVVERFGFDGGRAVRARRRRGARGAGGGRRARRAISPSWNPADPGRAPERLPLSVGDRTLGPDRARPASARRWTAAEVRVLRAVCDQLALVLERDRLLRAATDAEILKQTETTRRNDAGGGLARSAEPAGGDQGVGHRSARSRCRPLRRGARGGAAAWSTSETDRLDALVANLLDMSRIEAGVLQAQPETVDLAEAVTAEVDAAARALARRAHRAVVLDEQAPPRVADPVLLPRVAVEPAGQRRPRGAKRRRSDRGRSRSRIGGDQRGGARRRPRRGSRCRRAHAAVPAVRPAGRARRRSSDPGSGSPSPRGSWI